jgi:hypothetical protein
MEQMRNILRQTDERLIPAFQRFGRGSIAGYGPSETEQSRIATMSNSIPQLEDLVRERDDALLRVLTREQQGQFKTMQGKPLPMSWDAWQFMRQPFEKTNS